MGHAFTRMDMQDLQELLKLNIYWRALFKPTSQNMQAIFPQKTVHTMQQLFLKKTQLFVVVEQY